MVTTFGDFDDPRINWEYLKFKMREFSRNKAIKLAKARKLERENLEFKVNSYEKIINPSEDDLRGFDNAKSELKKIYAILQTELSHVLKLSGMRRGKKHPNTFFRKRKIGKAKTRIRKLKSDLHGEIVDPQFILSELKLVYKNLYKNTSMKT